jgi:hypothetical protein
MPQPRPWDQKQLNSSRSNSGSKRTVRRPRSALNPSMPVTRPSSPSTWCSGGRRRSRSTGCAGIVLPGPDGVDLGTEQHLGQWPKHLVGGPLEHLAHAVACSRFEVGLVDDRKCRRVVRERVSIERTRVGPGSGRHGPGPHERHLVVAEIDQYARQNLRRRRIVGETSVQFGRLAFDSRIGCWSVRRMVCARRRCSRRSRDLQPWVVGE